LIGCENQNPAKEEQLLLSQSAMTLEITKKEYELREKCGSYCVDYFHKVYQDKNKSDNYTIHSDYVSHYNKRTNKCYMFVKSKIVPKKDIGSIISSEYMVDVHENNTLGVITISSKENIKDVDKNKTLKESTISGKEDTIVECKMLDKNCKSKDEWDKFIKPFMEK